MAAKADRIPLGTRGSKQRIIRLWDQGAGERGCGSRRRAEWRQRPAEAAAQQNAAFQVNARQQRHRWAHAPRNMRAFSNGTWHVLSKLKRFLRRWPCFGGVGPQPDDPGLYEGWQFSWTRTGSAWSKRNLSRAIARFPDRSWYHKLARLYLRQRKNAEFEKLTQDPCASSRQ